MHLTIADALASLDGHEEPWRELFAHGSLSVEIYRPRGSDPQEPHTRDEVYVIASGSGSFVNGESRVAFVTGDVLFVAAGVEHRFVDFSNDFATWVIFYGPEGGEQAGGDPATF